MGGPDAGLHQRGPRPVVKLAVGDPGGGTGGRPAVPDVLGVGDEVVPEQETLLTNALDRRATLGWHGTAVRPAGKTPAQALGEGYLQLLGDPERALDPRHRIQLAEQFPAAGVIPREGKNDQPQHSTWGES